MIRRFWLENAAGERKPLNNEQGIFLENPYGLGLETGATYAGTGDGFFLEQKNTSDKQVPMGGDLVFLQDPYRTHTAFMDWVLRSEELTFVYLPATTAYRRRIALSAATKTEKDTPRSLRVPVTFLPLTPWYIEKAETYALGVVAEGGFIAWDEDEEDSGSSRDDGDIAPDPEEDSGDDERDDAEAPLDVDEFPLELDGGSGLEAETDDPDEDDTETAESRAWDENDADCTWARVSESSVMEDGVVIAARGHVAASYVLRFTGAAVRPTIRVIGEETGTEYGRCALDAAIAEGETLEFSTGYLRAYVRRISASGRVTDLLDAVDLSYRPFPRLPTTEACRVLITSEERLLGTLTIAVQRYLRGV